MIRDELVSIAGKPLRAIRSGRFWLSPVVAKLSPRHGAIMTSYRMEEEGRFDEALAAWSSLSGTQSSRTAAFRHKLRTARLAFKAGRLNEAVKEYGVLRALNPGDSGVTKGLESAALRAARGAQSQGKWLEAARMWSVFGQVTPKTHKAVRNLADCARYAAQSADTPEKMRDALEAWGLLKTLDPESREARQGTEWCHLSLARAAEKAQDLTEARKHWTAMLKLAPGDQRALDGLKRLDSGNN